MSNDSPQLVLQVAPAKPRRREVLTLGQAFEAWMAEGQAGSAKTTRAREVINLRTFLDFVGGQTVDGALIGRFYQHLATVGGDSGRPSAPGTLALYRQHLTTFFSWLEAQGYIQESPMRSAPKLPPVPKVEPEIITVEDYQKLMDAALTGKPAAMRWMMCLAWNTGMAIVDCALLTWQSVNMEAREIQFVRRKTARFGRMCRVTFEAGGELEDYLHVLQGHRSDQWPNKPPVLNYVHTECARSYLRTGKAIFTSGFRHLATIAGIERGKTFHSFRAAWCSRLINSGMNFNQVALTTGHQNPAVLQRYVRPDMGRLAEQVAAAFAAERRSAAINRVPARPLAGGAA